MAQWIKASDRLPSKDGFYYCRRMPRGGKYIYSYTKNGRSSFRNYKHNDLEWLDESIPASVEEAARYREALENIIEMKQRPGEKNMDYAFNRCWHIAAEALNT